MSEKYHKTTCMIKSQVLYFSHLYKYDYLDYVKLNWWPWFEVLFYTSILHARR